MIPSDVEQTEIASGITLLTAGVVLGRVLSEVLVVLEFGVKALLVEASDFSLGLMWNQAVFLRSTMEWDTLPTRCPCLCSTRSVSSGVTPTSLLRRSGKRHVKSPAISRLNSDFYAP